MDLYELSDKWLLRDLSQCCLEFLKENLKLDNFGKMAKKAEDIGAEELCEAISDFAVNQYELLEEKDLKEAPPSILVKIISKSKRLMRKRKLIRMN